VLLYAALSLLNDFFCDKAIIDKTLLDDICMYAAYSGIPALRSPFSNRCASSGLSKGSTFLRAVIVSLGIFSRKLSTASFA